MLIPDHGSALISLTEDTPDDVGEWPANHAHGRASRQLQGQGGREKEKARVFELVGGAPTQPTYDHHPITDRHQCRRSAKATCYLGHAGQVPDVGLPHYRDARMQHPQSTQPALVGVTAVAAPK